MCKHQKFAIFGGNRLELNLAIGKALKGKTGGCRRSVSGALGLKIDDI